MAMVIPMVGESYEIQPRNGKYFELDELQKVVGGYIEIVNLGKGKLMVVNEEGKLNDLEWNGAATAMYISYTRILDYIAGDVLVCDSNELI